MIKTLLLKNKQKNKTPHNNNNNSVQLDEELPSCWSFIVKCITSSLAQNVKCPVLNNQDTQKHYHHQLGNQKHSHPYYVLENSDFFLSHRDTKHFKTLVQCLCWPFSDKHWFYLGCSASDCKQTLTLCLELHTPVGKTWDAQPLGNYFSFSKWWHISCMFVKGFISRIYTRNGWGAFFPLLVPPCDFSLDIYNRKAKAMWWSASLFYGTMVLQKEDTSAGMDA